MLDTSPATWSGPTASDYERALWQSLSGPANPVTLHGQDGFVIHLEVGRYAARADSVDRYLLRHCTGPTLDIGCGPGRLAAELARRGVPALGVDITPVALLLARASGATVLGRSVFERLPAEGRWPHALLIDGNIGISGDPANLLHRIKSVLLPTGATLIVETLPHEADERHRLRPAGAVAHAAPTIPWARIGPTALRALATPLGYRITADWLLGGRRFVHLGT
jgi:SAM-dependent methyltransferase